MYTGYLLSMILLRILTKTFGWRWCMDGWTGMTACVHMGNFFRWHGTQNWDAPLPRASQRGFPAMCGLRLWSIQCASDRYFSSQCSHFLVSFRPWFTAGYPDLSLVSYTLNLGLRSLCLSCVKTHTDYIIGLLTNCRSGICHLWETLWNTSWWGEAAVAFPLLRSLYWNNSLVLFFNFIFKHEMGPYLLLHLMF